METEKNTLNETVQTLSTMTRDLEGQLERMLTINEELERELEQEKKNTAASEQERNTLLGQIANLEREVAAKDDLRAEIGHLGVERSRLAETIEELGNQLAEVEKENNRLGRLCERMGAERDNAEEELSSVEAQFERAMEILNDMRSRVTALADERDDLVERIKAQSDKLELAEGQRDSLRVEVDESRTALEEIRREVANACVSSQRLYYQEGKLE